MQNELELQENRAVSEATAKRDLMNMVYTQAKFYAASTIVPQQYQNNPSNCFIAIEMANRMGANPFQVMQSLNVIQGRPSWSSAFIIAAVNQSGRFKTQLNYKITGSWKEHTLACKAYATSIDGTLCESIEVNWQMAKDEGWLDKKGSKWQTMPELMIRYRAAAFFGRQFCPDLLLGLMTTEETRDIVDADFEVVSQTYKSTTEVNKDQAKSNASIKVDENGVVNKQPEQQPQVTEAEPVQEDDSNLFNYGN